jgi:hypothetical protein
MLHAIGSYLEPMELLRYLHWSTLSPYLLLSLGVHFLFFGNNPTLSTNSISMQTPYILH